MGNGRKAKAPCGHNGEVIIGQYVQCLQACELWAEDAPSEDCCPRCGEPEVDQDYELDPTYLLWNPDATLFDRRCRDCGHVWIC